MGTTAEWMRVLMFGGIFGSLMFAWDWLTKPESFAKLPSLASLLFGSFAYGMMITFEWRVVHGGISVIFAVAVLGVAAVGLAERRARLREMASKDR